MAGCLQACRQKQVLADAGAADAGTYDAFHSPQDVAIEGYSGDAMEPFLTRDGLYMLFNNRNEPPENTNLHWAKRVDDLKFHYLGEIPAVNTNALEAVASMDRDGNLYFVSNRSYDQTSSTIYRTRFVDGVAGPPELVEGVSRKIPGWAIPRRLPSSARCGPARASAAAAIPPGSSRTSTPRGCNMHPIFQAMSWNCLSRGCRAQRVRPRRRSTGRCGLR